METRKRGLWNGLNGPWTNEPDRFEDEYKGLKILVLRNPSLKFLCGYVGVPPNHPLYGKSYSDDDFPSLDVHGGVTFSGEGDGELRPKGYWWIGFDCGHAWDLIPSIGHLVISGKEAYRSLAYVIHETKSLANQLLEIQEVKSE